MINSASKYSPIFLGVTGLAILVLIGVSCSGNNGKQPADSANPEEASVQFAGGDTLNISGSLICAHCYALNRENTGHDHVLPQSGFIENCAGFCSLQGYPIAVFTENESGRSKVWVIRTSSQLFADYMTEKVRIKGTFVSDGVIEPLSIELKRGENQWITIM